MTSVLLGALRALRALALGRVLGILNGLLGLLIRPLVAGDGVEGSLVGGLLLVVVVKEEGGTLTVKR